MILKRFYPDYRAASVYDIDFDRLYREGVRGLLFDIDNTLVPHGAPADSRAVGLFARLREIGFHTCLISNNQPPRIIPFAKAVQSSAVCSNGLRSTPDWMMAFWNRPSAAGVCIKTVTFPPPPD